MFPFDDVIMDTDGMFQLLKKGSQRDFVWSSHTGAASDYLGIWRKLNGYVISQLQL